MIDRKIAFVTNFCNHYTVGVFEKLTRRVNVDYYFFSDGGEWYWEQKLGTAKGNFSSRSLPGFALGHTRITPTLPFHLLSTNYDVYIKCINGKFALPATYLVARLKRKPFILRTGIWGRVGAPFHKLVFPLTRFIYRRADALVVYGSHVKRYLVSEGVRPERIFVAPHSVDNSMYNRVVPQHEKVELRAKLGISNDKQIVLYLGRLEVIKGCKYLLEAFASIERADAILVIAGAGSERRNLEKLARKRNIAASVRFIGHVPQQEAFRYYSISYVYVLPSITTATGKETWGLVVNEAFNQGIPVIATTAVGAAAGGLVQDGIDGMIVPEQDSAALAAALRRVLDDTCLRQQMSRNASAEIANFTHERMADAFSDAIKYVLGTGAPASLSLENEIPAQYSTSAMD